MAYDVRFKIEYHFGGVLIREPKVDYVGGGIENAMNIDPDTCDFWWLKEGLLKEIGIEVAVKEAWYLVPRKTMAMGLEKVSGDRDVMEICKYGAKLGIVSL